MKTTADHGRLSIESPRARNRYSMKGVPWSAVVDVYQPTALNAPSWG